MCRIFIFADYDPLGYEFSCCGCFLLDHLNFLISCSERTVSVKHEVENSFDYYNHSLTIQRLIKRNSSMVAIGLLGQIIWKC